MLLERDVGQMSCTSAQRPAPALNALWLLFALLFLVLIVCIRSYLFNDEMPLTGASCHTMCILVTILNLKSKGFVF